MKTFNLILPFLFLISNIVLGGNNKTDSLKSMDFQLSILPMLSTNGIESPQYENKVSVNIIAGYQGGLNGIEVGGFANIIEQNAKGIQLAGFANVTQGKVLGFQGSGFVNVSGQGFEGMQGAGFVNVAGKSSKGIQGAGFVNAHNGHFLGIQGAGFVNANNGNLKGIQGAGFVNANHGNIDGGQFAGFVNANSGQVKGFQLAGFVNANLGDVNGIQAAGFVNTAKKVNGLQLGFINLNDTVENGLALGFLTFSKKGYRAVEISANESFYANLSFRTGLKKFYNIFTVGLQPVGNQLNWGLGYGVGMYRTLSNKIDLNFDITSYAVYEDAPIWKSYTNLNKINFGAELALSKNIKAFGAINYNIVVSNRLDNDDNLVGSMLPRYTLTNQTFNYVNVKSYPGLSVGFRF